MIYEAPPTSGALRQGEVLKDVWEHRPLSVSAPPPDGNPVQLESLRHGLAVVLTADCDLEQDFNARFPASGEPDMSDHRLIQWVLLCDLYIEGEIRGQIPAGTPFERVRSSQLERYHTLSEGEGVGPALAHLFLDFKKTFAMPTCSFYEDGAVPVALRTAVVPPIFIHDLMHRFYGFLSRVGLP